jgi:hypothetical protein
MRQITMDETASDSSSDESMLAQTLPSEAPTSMNTAPAPENDDSASDISMSADTDDEEDEAPQTSTIRVNHHISSLEQPTSTLPAGSGGDKFNKRRYSGSMEDAPNGSSRDVRKRLKPDDALHIDRTSNGGLPPDRSLLPAEIWHHIFTFIPPRNLGLLLSVNRSFNAFLDPSLPDHSITPLPSSVVSVMKPDAIWRASRRLFRPGMPAPLIGKSELDMWKLACFSSCQFCCKKKQPNPTVPVDQWHPGPGESGVVSIWSFGIRTCGPCIEERSTKVVHDLTFISFSLIRH